MELFVKIDYPLCIKVKRRRYHGLVYLAYIFWLVRSSCMQIIQNQFLCCNNLLSYRTRVKENRLFDLLEHMEKSAEILGMEIARNIIFTIKETVNSEKGKILDVEVLMPVSSEFESNEHFVFKPKLRIENALKIKCFLNYKNIFEVKSEHDKVYGRKTNGGCNRFL